MSARSQFTTRAVFAVVAATVLACVVIVLTAALIQRRAEEREPDVLREFVVQECVEDGYLTRKGCEFAYDDATRAPKNDPLWEPLPL